MTEDFTTTATRLKQIKQQTPEDEYFTLEATVTQLWDSNADSIKQVGLLRDPSGILKFISWKNSEAPNIEEDETYLFKNVSVNYPDDDDDDPEIVFRSKTEIEHQYTDTREQFLKGRTPKQQNTTVDYDEWPVTLDDAVSGVRIVEEGLDDAEVPWNISFFNTCSEFFGQDHPTKTRISEYNEDSVMIQRKYIIPHDSHKAGVEFFEDYEEMLESPYFKSEATGMYTSVTLARVGRCTMCDHLFDVREELGYDPVEESDGMYINWWYGGNGTEKNEDFELVTCPDCGAEPEWHEEYDYGSGVVRPPSVSKSVTLQFTVEFDTVETIGELVETVSSQVGTEFTVRHTTRTILQRKCDALNEKLGKNEVFSIKSSGEPDRRGLTRQYIQCSLRGLILKDGIERIDNILGLQGEEFCRVQEFQSHKELSSTTKINSYYYPVEKNGF